MAARPRKENTTKKAAGASDGGGQDALISAVVASAKKRVDFDVGSVGAPDYWFDTGSFALNWAMSGRALSGGWPGGRVVEIYGDPSTGKSLLIYKVMADTTRKGGYVVLDDTESCYMPPYAAKLGVDNSRVIPIDSDTVEEHVERIIELHSELRKKGGKEIPILLALDSLAQLSTAHEMETDMEKRDLSKPQTIRKGIRKVRIALKRDSRTLYMISNHVTANIGDMYNKKCTTGGTAVPFASSVRLELQLRGDVKEPMPGDAQKTRKVGMQSRAVISKNKIIAPFRECRVRIMHKHGLIQDYDLFTVAKAAEVCKVVTPNGWCEMKGHDGRFQEAGFWKDDVWRKALKLLDVPPE